MHLQTPEVDHPCHDPCYERTTHDPNASDHRPPTLDAPPERGGSVHDEYKEDQIGNADNEVERMDDTFRKRECFSPRSLHYPKPGDFAEDRAEGREGIDYQNQQPSDRNSHGERTPAGPKIGPDVPGHRDHEKDKWYQRHA